MLQPLVSLSYVLLTFDFRTFRNSSFSFKCSYDLNYNLELEKSGELTTFLEMVKHGLFHFLHQLKSMMADAGS